MSDSARDEALAAVRAQLEQTRLFDRPRFAQELRR